MNSDFSEQALRREAIRRHLQGESRGDICHDLDRATSWFDKWWAAYRHNPQTDFADQSRAPHTSPQALPGAVVQAVLEIRQTFEAATRPETKYGLIGNRAIQHELERLTITPVPSLATIQRILAQHALTHPVGAGCETAYYPWPVAWDINAIHATDIITRHVRGGEVIENFHTIDHYSHAVALTQHANKTSATMGLHLRKTWAKLGLPWVAQMDNESAFCGGHSHPRIMGQVVRLCLLCGIEPFFTPIYEAKRNYQIETFHSLWDKSFWSRQMFDNRAHVQTETPTFLHWYHTRYHPPSLHGQTPAQVRAGASLHRFTAALQHLLPTDRLPITKGRLHFMRKVDSAGIIKFLNEPWALGTKWSGEYIRATINTAKQVVTFWHKADDQTDWYLLKTRAFQLHESVHDLLPAFRRNRTRCRDYWPD